MKKFLKTTTLLTAILITAGFAQAGERDLKTATLEEKTVQIIYEMFFASGDSSHGYTATDDLWKLMAHGTNSTRDFARPERGFTATDDLWVRDPSGLIVYDDLSKQ